MRLSFVKVSVTLTSTLIIPDITKTSSNNCLECGTETATSIVLEWGRGGVGDPIQSGLAIALCNTQKMLQSNPSLQTPLC